MPERVDLAKSAAFRIGRLFIHPPTREIVADGGERAIVEPRVMQVLIALARANGAIVARDELTESCWEGRIVGEDAINRVISRLRRVAEGIGAGSFRIETVTKVGYRLVRPGDPPASQAAALAPAARRLPSRRLVLAGGAGLAALAAAGFLLGPFARRTEGESDPLMAQALLALRQDTTEANNQAIGLLRQAVQQRPGDADAWGALAYAYARSFTGYGPPDPAMDLRARAAAARAREIDPDNAYAALALALPRPWLERESMLRSALAAHPDHDLLLRQLGWLIANLGRWREAADLLTHAVRSAPPAPGLLYTQAMCLWGAGRLEEADAALDRGRSLFPTYYSLWFGRYFVSLFTGRADDALRLAEDQEGRPTGIPPSEFDQMVLVARGMASGRPADVDKAMAVSVEAAHHGSGHAENGIQFASAFGRIDTAFAIADALYFGRGFDPGEVRFSPEQGSYTRRSARRTYILFLPSTAAMRADPRFAALVAELGLERYWQQSRSVPDYRR